MTRIKYRYSIPYCCLPEQPEERIYHSDLWQCDSNDGCVYGKYENPLDPALAINPICAHCEIERGEFEKSVDFYEYFEGGCLIIKGETYWLHDIDYLEIDGRVLIGEEKNT